MVTLDQIGLLWRRAGLVSGLYSSIFLFSLHQKHSFFENNIVLGKKVFFSLLAFAAALVTAICF